MAETLGDTAGIERVKGFSGRAIAGMDGVNGLHVSSLKDLPKWKSA
jgi:hypothetical protein